MESKYKEFDAELVSQIKSGNDKLSILENQKRLIELAKPHCSRSTPEWRIIDRRLQSLRKRGVIFHNGKYWEVFK